MTGASLFRVGTEVEFWRVALHLSVLVLFVIAFERGLHALEHRTKRYPKYEEMLSKAYRELMILGFVGLAIKIAKEMISVDANDPALVAFNVADLTIFILALALILQASCVFLRLRNHNRRIDHAELVSTTDLVDAVLLHHQSPKAPSAQLKRCVWSRSSVGSEPLSQSWRHCREIVELRVLRHIFLRRYGLPELFPFSKYIRLAQDNQITHMIDVEISTWFLLIVVAWGLEGAMECLQLVDSEKEPRALVKTFLVFAWALVALHCAAAYYFNLCLRQLLKSAGYSASNSEMLDCLKRIAQEEADAWSHELAVDALGVMQRVQEKAEARHLKRKRKRHHMIESDTGFQLIATCFRHAKLRAFGDRKHANCGRGDEHAMSVEVPPADGERPQIHRQHSLAPVEIRWFSRKAWHFIVMFLLMLNGFYLALLCQCILYQLGTVYHELGWFLTLLVPLPLLLNTLVLQPRIFRSFMIVCSIFRVHTSTLTEVIAHFSETVELRSEFATSLSQSLKHASRTAADLQRELAAKDPSDTGLIEVEKLRLVLRTCGLELSHSRFNSVAKMLFKMTKGTKIEYVQVLRLLSLANQQDVLTMDSFSFGGCAPPSLPLLRQSFAAAPDQVPSGSAPQAVVLSNAPPVSELPPSRSRCALLKRNDSQYFGASSRAIRCLYHLESMECDLLEDQVVTHYVRM
ncbi:hypothetical protein Gpo141_00009919 [Globisporangium polare]